MKRDKFSNPFLKALSRRKIGIYLSSYISMELTFRPTHAIDNKVTINF